MMEYTASVNMEVVQKNGKTVYSDFSVEINGKTYSEKDEKSEKDPLVEEMYNEMLQVHKKWKKKRIR